MIRRCIEDAELRPAAEGEASATVKAGDEFAVLDCGRGLAWGYRVSDHLVGYVDRAKLTP